MNSYFGDYTTVVTFLGLGFLLMSVFLGVAAIFKPNNPTKEKLTTYECGVDPVGDGWSQSYVRYYIFGLLFVIFTPIKNLFKISMVAKYKHCFDF